MLSETTNFLKDYVHLALTNKGHEVTDISMYFSHSDLLLLALIFVFAVPVFDISKLFTDARTNLGNFDLETMHTKYPRHSSEIPLNSLVMVIHTVDTQKAKDDHVVLATNVIAVAIVLPGKMAKVSE